MRLMCDVGKLPVAYCSLFVYWSFFTQRDDLHLYLHKLKPWSQKVRQFTPYSRASCIAVPEQSSNFHSNTESKCLFKRNSFFSYFFIHPVKCFDTVSECTIHVKLALSNRTPRLNEAWRQYGFMQSVYKWYVSSYEFHFFHNVLVKKCIYRLYVWNMYKHLVPGGGPKSPGAWGNQNCRFDNFWGDQKTTKGRVLEEVRDTAANNTVP